jgi:hypothetical protein
MKTNFTLLICIITLNVVFCQQKDTLLYDWVPEAAIGLNVNQIALSNWTAGGDNAISWTLSGNIGLKDITKEWGFVNNLSLAYGRTKSGGGDFRTNDNTLYFESLLFKKINWAVDPFLSVSVRTGLTRGYDYRVNPPSPSADFFDPGYLTQSTGFVYNRITGFTTRLGIALQEVFTNKFDTLYNKDPETGAIKKVIVDTGLESVTTAEYSFAENLLYKGNLRLFTRFKSLDVWDVRWENEIVAKINRFLNVSVSYLFLYEKAQSPTDQMKESLQLGFVVRII